MKDNIDIYCTLEKRHRFFGLPVVVALQERLTNPLERQMGTVQKDLVPDTVLKVRLLTGMEGFVPIQRAFWV